MDRNKMIDKFVENLKSTFNERLSSVFLYGSCAVGECRESSDLNLMVIVENLKAVDLKLANKFIGDFNKIKNSLPIFMDKEEWFNSCDVYAIEYADIKQRNKILYGENLIDNLQVDKKYLRLQCEQDVKNLLIRLRQGYLLKINDNKSIKNIIKFSSKTFIVMFRTILRLLNENVPIIHEDVVKIFAEKIKNTGIEFEEELFLKIIEFRENDKLIKDSELELIIQKLIDTTDSVLKYVDKL